MNRSTCMLAGVCTGFLVAITAVLLITPMGGKEMRRKLSSQWQAMKGYSEAAKERMKKREEKAYKIGKEKYERLLQDMEDIKAEAKQFAKEELRQ